MDPSTPAPWNGASHSGVLLNRPRCSRPPSLKGAQVWDFDVLDFNDFFSWSLYRRGLEGWNKFFSFFTDGWDTGHFVLATACAVYASKLLPYAPSTLAICNRIRSKVLPHARSTLIRVLRVYPFVLATACAVYASKVLPYAAYTLAICYRMPRLR